MSSVFIPLFAQAGGVEPRVLDVVLLWMRVIGDPQVTIGGKWGGLLSWVKVVALFSLLGWVFHWVLRAYQNSLSVSRVKWLDYAAGVAVLGGIGTALLQVLQSTEKIHLYPIVMVIAGTTCALIVSIWIERAVWACVLRLGTRVDFNVLAAVHVALGVGVVVSLLLRRMYLRMNINVGYANAIADGVRYGATFMGFVVLLRVASLILPDIVAIRPRRLYAIAWHTVVESTRRMWAPYVVVAVFLVVLAFTSWFLQEPPRAAEYGRLYVITLTLLCSLLLTIMVVFLTPLSLPSDIQNQTIYTIVSKPVRRLELVWGRIIGFMALVTVLVLLFGGFSLAYLSRQVGGQITRTESEAKRAEAENRLDEAKTLREQADQMRTRMGARIPVRGALTFLDSRAAKRLKGVDVGQEMQFRSFIEGATPAAAIWKFGQVLDPRDEYFQDVAKSKGMAPPPRSLPLLDRRIPLDRFLAAGTIEAKLDEFSNLEQEVNVMRAEQRRRSAEGKDSSALADAIKQKAQLAAKLRGDLDQLKAKESEIRSKADAEEKAGRSTAAADLRDEADKLHSPDIPIEMTFTVYRTTKGQIGDAVYASLSATNPYTGERYPTTFPVHEYYTNKEAIPAGLLAGSHGFLTIEVKCISSTQYLGMTENDLYVLAETGNFGVNFMKGLAGVWLQALILTTIGVFAGTFLSWPVALLTTFAFWLAGLAAFNFLQDLASNNIVGGGPFESFIRLIAHNNQVVDLAPTIGVVAAKTLDSLVMPVMSRLVFIVPNFSVFDFSNTISNGFAVTGDQLFDGVLLACGYAAPFSLIGFLILKNREVAA